MQENEILIIVTNISNNDISCASFLYKPLLFYKLDLINNNLITKDILTLDGKTFYYNLINGSYNWYCSVDGSLIPLGSQRIVMILNEQYYHAVNSLTLKGTMTIVKYFTKLV